MAPVTIAIGFKADGTALHVYTGFNALEAVDKLNAAGAGKQIVEGAVFHNPTPIKVLKFNGSGVGREDASAFDEAARMKRINELKKLSHTDLVKAAMKLGVITASEDEKVIESEAALIKGSMQKHMTLVVKIYDAEAAEKAKPRRQLPPADFIEGVEERRRQADLSSSPAEVVEAGRLQREADAREAAAKEAAAKEAAAKEAESKPKGMGGK